MTRKVRKRENDKPNDGPDGGAALPRKRFYRQRAHANPFSDHQLKYPTTPEMMNWWECYPHFASGQPATTAETDESAEQIATPTAFGAPRQLQRAVEVVDIGCGFGGLLVALAPRMPDSLMLGLEIRSQVTEFVQKRISALRLQHAGTNLYENIWCIRANSMKFLPNFFAKGQLSKIFICFPDPHFKSRKHKARIVSATLNSEYAFVLKPGGIIYTITDVEALHEWIVEHFDAHPSFDRVSTEEQDLDESVKVMTMETEEGKKVERNNGPKFVALYQRLEDPQW